MIEQNSQNGLLLVEELDHDGHGVAIITFNRPEARNPIDANTLAALDDALSRLTNDQKVSAIVLTGAGSSFSAGGDMKGYQSLYRNRPGFEDFVELFATVCRRLEHCAALTVAMVNGTCVAGGLELALACDLITMADEAQIGDGHLKFGQLPGAGGSQRLVHAIGMQRAKHWLLSAELFTAEEAVKAGLAIASFPANALRSRTFELIEDLVGHSPLARQRMKELIQIAGEHGMPAGLRKEIEITVDYACGTHDALEGLNAFAERREARYRGK